MKKNRSALSLAFASAYNTIALKGLSLMVKPTVMGETPDLGADPTFYALDARARVDRLLLEKQLKDANLPSALAPVHQGDVREASATLFLKRDSSDPSARLLRLVNACLKNPRFDPQIAPVTILWGRAPEKEESIFRLLMADEWRVPSVGKQLFNVGAMGRDTFVQFYNPKKLQDLIADAKKHSDDPTRIACAIHKRLQGYLQKQRTSILGPDLSDRRNISDSVLGASVVQEAIAAKAAATGKSPAALKKEAKGYIDEIASDYSYAAVRAFDRFLSRLWTRLYDGVEVRHFERVRDLAPDYQIVYVPCHRSHMDYLLLSYVIYNRGLRIPHVAAGANLNLPILGEFLRAGGAFFLRRSFRDNPLYGAVFKAYLHSLMQRSAPIEYFIEGGRSRSGRLLSPKLGMLAMTVQSHLEAPAKPVAFIPTYISYERIMEGTTYVGELQGKPKESENWLQILKTARKIERVFGTAHLSFGEPLFLDDFIQKFEPSGADKADPKLSALIQNLGVKIMQRINKAAVVNPVSLIALTLLSTPKAALDKDRFLAHVALYQDLARRLPYDDDAFVTDMAPEDTLAYGKKLKLIAQTPHILGDMVQAASGQAPMLSYFRNNVAHVFILPSLIAALVQRNGRIRDDDLRAIAQLLYPFLQAELFLKYAQKNLNLVIDRVLQALIETELVVDLGAGVLAAPSGDSENYQKLQALANLAQQSLERYFMALALLAQQGSGKLSLAQVVELCHLVGQRASVLYGVDLPDGFDKALFRNFLEALLRSDYMQEEDGVLLFDERIGKIADYARFALNGDAQAALRHVTDLSADDWANLGKKSKK